MEHRMSYWFVFNVITTDVLILSWSVLAVIAALLVSVTKEKNAQCGQKNKLTNQSTQWLCGSSSSSTDECENDWVWMFHI